MINETPRIQKMRQKLDAALTPTHLEIIDESIDHVGHEGAQSGLGHFLIRISSPQFQSKNLIGCHRLVYQALDTMMTTDIHALKIDVITR